MFNESRVLDIEERPASDHRSWVANDDEVGRYAPALGPKAVNNVGWVSRCPVLITASVSTLSLVWTLHLTVSLPQKNTQQD